jgi:hypothetical protein
MGPRPFASSGVRFLLIFFRNTLVPKLEWLCPDHLRLAVLLQAHCTPIKLPAFQVGFISDDQQPVVTTNFGNIGFSGDPVGTCITYRFNGLWVLKVEGQPFDLNLGHGALTVDVFTSRSLAHPDRARMLAPNQIGFIWLHKRRISCRPFRNHHQQLLTRPIEPYTHGKRTIWHSSCPKFACHRIESQPGRKGRAILKTDRDL